MTIDERRFDTREDAWAAMAAHLSEMEDSTTCRIEVTDGEPRGVA